jgi:hypothetical protein
MQTGVQHHAAHNWIMNDYESDYIYIIIYIYAATDYKCAYTNRHVTHLRRKALEKSCLCQGRSFHVDVEGSA